MNQIALLLLTLNCSLAVLGVIPGTYRNNGPNSDDCSSIKELVLTADKTIVQRSCPSQSNSNIVFGTWITSNSKTVVFLTSNTSKMSELVEVGNQLKYDNLLFDRVNDPIPLTRVADIFGNWQASTDQNEAQCQLVKKLNILNNGQMLRTHCFKEFKDWFEKGFFTLQSLNGNTINVSTTANGTTLPFSLEIISPTVMKMNGQVTLNKV